MQDDGTVDGGETVPDDILKVEFSAGADESNKSLDAKVLYVYRTQQWLRKAWPVTCHWLTRSSLFPIRP